MSSTAHISHYLALLSLLAAATLSAGCEVTASECTSDAECPEGRSCVSGGGILVAGGRCLPESAADTGPRTETDPPATDTGPSPTDTSDIASPDSRPPAYTWETGPWSECSAPCEGGEQTRRVTCRDRSGDEADPGACEADRPPESRRCNDMPCEYAWNAEPWSDCDLMCNQQRTLTCRNTTVGTDAPEDKCPEDRPPTEQRCPTGPDPTRDPCGQCGGGQLKAASRDHTSEGEIHVVWQYEGDEEGSTRQIDGRPETRTRVQVAERPRPIRLILHSYEPTHWMLEVHPDTAIDRILLVGHHPSRVTGTNAPVDDLIDDDPLSECGREWPDQQSDECRDQVAYLGEAPLTSFVSCYEGHSFVVR